MTLVLRATLSSYSSYLIQKNTRRGHRHCIVLRGALTTGSSYSPEEYSGRGGSDTVPMKDLLGAVRYSHLSLSFLQEEYSTCDGCGTIPTAFYLAETCGGTLALCKLSLLAYYVKSGGEKHRSRIKKHEPEYNHPFPRPSFYYCRNSAKNSSSLC